jgi:Holliday junction resolvase RusA-like endonuclease
MTATFVFPPLKSWSKKEAERLQRGETVYKTTKPDVTDNLMKGLCDAMTGVVWIDDSRVAKVNSQKIYGTTPMILIEVKPL